MTARRDTSHVPDAHARIVDGDVFRRLCRARELARDDVTRRLTIPDLARAAGISEFHFQRLHRRAFGETAHAFVTRVRLARAKELLARRGASVTEVCFDVGFASVGSFSALFSREIGVSPRAFQREMIRIAQVPEALWGHFVPYCFAQVFAGADAVEEQLSRSGEAPGGGTSPLHGGHETR